MNAELPHDDFPEKKIIIIGAGMAGLSAAVKLKELNFKCVQLLEAKDSIGGRTKTLHFDSNFIEMGAQWIHGQNGNCIYELAKKNDLLDLKAPDYLKSLFEFENLSKSYYKENIVNTLEILLDTMDEYDSTKENVLNSEGSVSANLFEAFQKYLQQCNSVSLNCVAENACYDWFTKLECEYNGCNNLCDVSKYLLQKYKTFEGSQVTELKYGYSAILKILTQTIPSEWVIKNQNVTNITWSSEPDVENLVKKVTASTLLNNDPHKWHPITIYCDNGLIYYADHVIVTVPLGCLKVNAYKLFQPQLPSKKLKAIESLGFGVVDKIYLEYEDPFWEGPVTYNMLWFDDSFQKISKNSSCEKDMDGTWFKYISRFAYTPQHPKMLCAWIVGEGAIFMEALPESQVLSECHKLIKEQLERDDLPHPIRIIRSSWASDPYSLGSYSYNSIACEETQTSHENLAEPVLVRYNNSMYPMLLFAGEATHSQYFSTVHGAYETGIREANRIFDYYQ